ncbi:MAG: YIP1 family protein [Candidatus Hodarchaeales archaeon]
MSNDVPNITPKFCGNCGQKILEGATFCAYCGAPIPAIDTSESSTTETPSKINLTYPSSSHRNIHPYSAPYRTSSIRTEPALPFFQHFQGVLLSPHLEMPKIVNRPNFGQPFLLVILTGILVAVTIFLYYSKVTIITTPEFEQEYLSLVGFTPEMIEEFDLATLLQFSLMLGAPLGILIDWIVINTLVLWILHAIFSSQTPSYRRNFKTMVTITGWSFLPRIFGEAITLVYVAFFVPSSSITITSIEELAVLDSLGITGIFYYIFFLIWIGVNLWGALIVYFGAKSNIPEGSNAIIIAVIYFIIPFILSFLALPAL